MNKKSMLLIGILLLSLRVSAQNDAPQDLFPAEIMNAVIQDLNGENFRLAEGKGEIRIVLLWASWCGPCRYALEGLNKQVEAYARRNVEIIGLSMDHPVEDEESFRVFIRSFKSRFKIGRVDEKMAKVMLAGKPSIPHILVVTTDGRVVKRFVGYHPTKSLVLLEEAVEQYLAGQNKER